MVKLQDISIEKTIHQRGSSMHSKNKKNEKKEKNISEAYKVEMPHQDPWFIYKKTGLSITNSRFILQDSENVFAKYSTAFTRDGYYSRIVNTIINHDLYHLPTNPEEVRIGAYCRFTLNDKLFTKYRRIHNQILFLQFEIFCDLALKETFYSITNKLRTAESNGQTVRCIDMVMDLHTRWLYRDSFNYQIGIKGECNMNHLSYLRKDQDFSRFTVRHHYNFLLFFMKQLTFTYGFALESRNSFQRPKSYNGHFDCAIFKNMIGFKINFFIINVSIYYTNNYYFNRTMLNINPIPNKKFQFGFFKNVNSQVYNPLHSIEISISV